MKISERACEIASERAPADVLGGICAEVGIADLAQALDEWQDRVEKILLSSRSFFPFIDAFGDF